PADLVVAPGHHAAWAPELGIVAVQLHQRVHVVAVERVVAPLDDLLDVCHSLPPRPRAAPGVYRALTTHHRAATVALSDREEKGRWSLAVPPNAARLAALFSVQAQGEQPGGFGS